MGFFAAAPPPPNLPSLPTFFLYPPSLSSHLPRNTFLLFPEMPTIMCSSTSSHQCEDPTHCPSWPSPPASWHLLGTMTPSWHLFAIINAGGSAMDAGGLQALDWAVSLPRLGHMSRYSVYYRCSGGNHQSSSC